MTFPPWGLHPWHSANLNQTFEETAMPSVLQSGGKSINPATNMPCFRRFEDVSECCCVQSVTREQVKPAADKIAEQAEPTANKANKQIKKGAQLIADNVSLFASV